jgi:hypothetical protein
MLIILSTDIRFLTGLLTKNNPIKIGYSSRTMCKINEIFIKLLLSFQSAGFVRLLVDPSHA